MTKPPENSSGGGMAKAKAPMGRTSRVTLEERLDAQQQQIKDLEEQIARISMHIFRRRVP